jgi:hypothetical protein
VKNIAISVQAGMAKTKQKRNFPFASTKSAIHLRIVNHALIGAALT